MLVVVKPKSGGVGLLFRRISPWRNMVAIFAKANYRSASTITHPYYLLDMKTSSMYLLPQISKSVGPVQGQAVPVICSLVEACLTGLGDVMSSVGSMFVRRMTFLCLVAALATVGILWVARP